MAVVATSGSDRLSDILLGIERSGVGDQHPPPYCLQVFTF